MVSDIKVKHKLRVFENRLLRRICRPKRDGVTGEWRKLHNLHYSPSIIRIYKVEEDEVSRACGPNGGEEERVYVIHKKVRMGETTRKTKT
jgi:hypothetical protein